MLCLCNFLNGEKQECRNLLVWDRGRKIKCFSLKDPRTWLTARSLQTQKPLTMLLLGRLSFYKCTHHTWCASISITAFDPDTWMWNVWWNFDFKLEKCPMFWLLSKCMDIKMCYALWLDKLQKLHILESISTLITLNLHAFSNCFHLIFTFNKMPISESILDSSKDSCCN